MARFDKGSVSWSDEDIKTLKKMKNDGSSMKDIANAVGRSYSATSTFIQRHGDRFGIVVQRRSKPAKDFNDICFRLMTKPWKLDNITNK